MSAWLPEALLRQGLKELALSLSEKQIQQLLEFVGLLLKWNRVYNLTAIDSAVDVVRLHLLDSLVVAAHIEGKRILDVGSGAGLPGIPLAIAYPSLDFYLLDSSAKKARFMLQASIELGLSNVTVIHSRVEAYSDPNGGFFDTIVCRAFSTFGVFFAAARRLLNDGGLLIAFKGRDPAAEISDGSCSAVEIVRVSVPGVDAERHFVVFRNG